MITLYSEYAVLNTELIEKNLKSFHIKSRDTIFPGQFYMIYIKGLGEMPIFPYVTDENIISFAIENTDNALSKKLFLLKPKESIFIRGPYGKGFPMNNFLSKDIKILFNEETLPQTLSVLNYIIKNEKNYGTTTIFNFNSKKMVPLNNLIKAKNEIKLNGISSIEAIDKGVLGENLKKDQIYLVMIGFSEIKSMIYKLINLGVAEKNIYFFLNRKITCGTGICGMCATKGMHACTDGPVFRSESLDKVL